MVTKSHSSEIKKIEWKRKQVNEKLRKIQQETNEVREKMHMERAAGRIAAEQSKMDFVTTVASYQKQAYEAELQLQARKLAAVAKEAELAKLKERYMQVRTELQELRSTSGQQKTAMPTSDTSEPPPHGPSSTET